MSQNKTSIIYLPGLGDGYDSIRKTCLWGWRLYGATVQLVPSRWTNSEDLSEKIDRVDQAVQAAVDKGRRVVLIGESAGGSLALNAYANNLKNVAGVVTLCGKNHRANNVSPRLYQRNQSFRTSMDQVDTIAQRLTRQQRQKITSVYAIYDPYVPRADTLIPDCRQVKLYSVGHLTSILVGLTFGSFILIREARRLSN